MVVLLRILLAQAAPGAGNKALRRPEVLVAHLAHRILVNIRLSSHPMEGTSNISPEVAMVIIR
jgi:hypothetical protein